MDPCDKAREKGLARTRGSLLGPGGHSALRTLKGYLPREITPRERNGSWRAADWADSP